MSADSGPGLALDGLRKMHWYVPFELYRKMMRNGSLSGQGSDVPSSIEYISEIIYETPPTKVHSIPPFPDSATATGVPVVRTEEALIVIFVLILWVAAIALFFNRWGKIRMLEPYQPKFHQEHRSSCPMVDINHPSMAQRSSFSKFNVNCLEPPPHFAAVPPTYRSLVRPRQNSVFVGSSNNMFAVQINPPRKTKSAVDIKSLVLNEKPPMSKSMLPMSSERRPSSSTLGIRRSSCLLSPRPSCDRRPSSCSEFLPGSKDRHTYCNEFLSPMHSFDRRTSASGDYLSPHRDQRRPSFNNVIAQVTAERRPSSSMLRISNV